MSAEEHNQLGKYRLLGRIGYGGMAEVWVAHQQGPMGFEKMVAIKRLLAHMENERNFVRMFLDEARIAARISHANVVQIFDLGLVDQKFYIAMEYLAGESLARIMGEGIRRGKPLPVHIAAMVLAQMCKGLHHAHYLQDNEGQSLNIVHRDVSPQNVMVLYDGGVKLLDFGIAKAKERLSETTVTGLKGKYAYMSPEQCRGDPIDQRSDIFASGTVLWEILARRRLFKHASKLMTLKMITEGHVPPPSSANPDVPPELDAICLKALSNEVDGRYESAMEMSTAIDEYLVSAGVASSVVKISDYMGDVFAEDQERRVKWLKEATVASRDSLETLQSAEYWLDLVPEASDTVISFSKSSVQPPLQPPRQSPFWWILTAVVAVLAAVAAITLLVISPASSGSRLRVQSTPAGAMIVVDGKLWKGKTPGAVEELSPGRHDLELVLKGHKPWRRRIDLAEGETLRVEADLQPRVASPAQADAGASDLATGDAAVKRPDASVKRQDARVRRADSARGLDATDAASAAPSQPDASVRHAPIVIRTHRPPHKPRREHGFINLATVPWATIFHGRRRLGNTPLVRVKLPAGRVRLRAVNRAAGINTTFTVEIVKGKVTRKGVQLKK
jgi:serine/threonine protein kinase